MPKETPHPYGLTMTLVPDGRFRPHEAQLRTSLTMKRMSCGISSIAVGEVPAGSAVVFKSLYNIRGQNNITEQADVVIEETEAVLAVLGHLPWTCTPTGGPTNLAFGPGVFKDTTLSALRAFQMDTNVIREDNATAAGLSSLPPMLREDGHLDPPTLAALRERVQYCEECLRDRVPGIALPHQPKTRIMWRQADTVHAELRTIQQRYSLHPIDGTYNAATLHYIGVVQLPPDDKVGNQQESIDGMYPASYQQVMSSSTATDLIADDIDQETHFAPTPLVPVHDAYSTPKTQRRMPMSAMDDATPLTPRTRLILGIGPDPHTPVVATELPNALYGSCEPNSPQGSPVRPLSPDRAASLLSESEKEKPWVMKDQMKVMQVDLLTQQKHAEDSVRQVEEAKRETENLRNLVSSLEGQLKTLQAGVMASSRSQMQVGAPEAINRSPVTSEGAGVMVLDVLGLLWLYNLIQGWLGKSKTS